MAKGLGEFEQLLLFALVGLPEDQAYGVPIRDEIEQRTGRSISAGAVYTALDRLEDKGLVASRVGAPTALRGGRRKRFYRLTAAGITALDGAVRTFQDMSRGLQGRLASLRAGLDASPRRAR